MITFASFSTSVFTSDAPTIVVPVKAGDDRGPFLAEAIELYGQALFDQTFAAYDFTGKAKTACKVVAGDKTIICVGVGDKPSATIVRRGVGQAIRLAPRAKAVAIGICGTPGRAQAATEGAVLGLYEFLEFKTKDVKPHNIPSIAVHTPNTTEADQAFALAKAVIDNRDDVNTPPNAKRPPVFADRIVKRFADNAQVNVEVHDEVWLREHHAGGILGVCRGSSEEPRLIKLEYKPAGATKHVVLVGKGITFDTGGISLKDSGPMETMKSDMAGASAVAATVAAAAELALPVRVTALMCMAENMPDGDATRVSDVVTMYNNSTVEVNNTDAEGRMVLADGLAYACDLEPDYVIDIATLTGAQMIVSGEDVACVMGNDDELVAAINAAGASIDEQYVTLPLLHDYRDTLDSTVADISNIASSRWAGTIVPALFLETFVTKGTKWAHLDIAGPSFNMGKTKDYRTKGGTGFGVRTLVTFIKSLSA